MAWHGWVDQVNWPQAIAGAIVGLVLSGFAWLIKALYDSWIMRRNLPYRVKGTWYSAEFDPKGDLRRGDRNTVTKVRITHRLVRGISIRVEEQLPPKRSRVRTSWEVRGKIVHQDTLVGTWETTAPRTKRYGAVVLKFIDSGRAVGYWTGPAGKDYPAYGYWILSQQESDARRIAAAVLDRTQFDFIDVAGFVMSLSPPVKAGPDTHKPS